MENERLTLLFPKHSTERLMRKFGRTSSSISAQACALGLKKDPSQGYPGPDRNSRKWTEKEIAFLKKHYKRMKYLDVAAKLRRSSSSVNLKVQSLGFIKNKNKVWAVKEKKQLKKIYHQHTRKEVAEIFGCTLSSLSKQVRKLAIPGKYRLWTNAEIRYLAKNYKRLTLTQIAQHVKHSTKSIYEKARKLGLRKR